MKLAIGELKQALQYLEELGAVVYSVDNETINVWLKDNPGLSFNAERWRRLEGMGWQRDNHGYYRCHNG